MIVLIRRSSVHLSTFVKLRLRVLQFVLPAQQDPKGQKETREYRVGLDPKGNPDFVGQRVKGEKKAIVVSKGRPRNR